MAILASGLREVINDDFDLLTAVLSLLACLCFSSNLLFGTAFLGGAGNGLNGFPLVEFDVEGCEPEIEEEELEDRPDAADVDVFCINVCELDE